MNGKILVCINLENPRTDKGQQAVLDGAVGMILANDVEGDKFADAHVLPASHVDFNDTIYVINYINNTTY